MRKNGYDFYLKKCLLPIAPEKLQIKINNANDTLTLINGEEINILKNAELTDIEFECRIPQVKYPFATYKSGFKGAHYFLDYFEELKTDKKPFQFIVYRTMPNGRILFPTNIKVTMEDYKITEQAKDGFDLMVKIKLKQYRYYGAKTVNIKISDSKPKAKVEKQRAADPPVKKSYGVGDIVNFHGGTHYYSSYPGAKGYSARAGKAKITIANGSGKAHPWHLIHTDSGSNVYGWVDDGTFD
ncbi:MAG: peptidoglycan-binding protein LysM [Clostridium sp.]|nr:peptidoglycan-binding protein LysM [Clostridium sp.]